MISRIGIFLLLCGLMVPSRAQRDLFNHALEIRLVTAEGQVLDNWSVESFVCEGQEYSGRFHGLRGDPIPTGQCRFAFKHLRPNRNPIIFDGRLVRSFADDLVVLAVPPDLLDDASVSRSPVRVVSLEGQLLGLPSVDQGGAPVWARFSQLYARDQFEVPVDANGRFVVFRVLKGKYLVTILQGETVLATSLIAVTGNRAVRLEVQVPANPLEVKRL